MTNNITITIDGPAGAGKSTVAKRIAEVLDISYLDTGAMYRALTLKALRNKVNLEDEEQLAALAEGTKIDLKSEGREVTVRLDGEDVSQEIRSLDVTNNTFYVARTPKVRAIMVQWQRKIGEARSIVAEGRDLGTVVFPQAEYKFYLDANVNERTQRRLKEYQGKGKDVDETILLEEIKERDHKDQSRDVGPLKKAEDAYLIDTTELSIEEVVENILQHINH